MALEIVESCVNCWACEPLCPNKAIFRAENLPAEWAGFAWVDATWCGDPGQARSAIDAYMPIQAA